MKKTLILAISIFVAIACNQEKSFITPTVQITNQTEVDSKLLANDADFKLIHSRLNEIDDIVHKAFENMDESEITESLEKLSIFSKNIKTENDLYSMGKIIGLDNNSASLFKNLLINQGKTFEKIGKKYPSISKLPEIEQQKLLFNATSIVNKKNLKALTCQDYSNCVSDAQATMVFESALCGFAGPFWVGCLGVTSSHYIYNHHVCEKRHNPGGRCGHQ